MKRNLLFVFSMAALLVMVGGAAASSVTRLRADVPFDFYIGTEQFKAGEYVFEIGKIGGSSAAASSVTVLSHDRTAVNSIITIPGPGVDPADSHLHFNRYGQNYFLSKVEGAGLQANLIPTRNEKELKALNLRDQGKTYLALK